jgi:DNA-binding response OmpR family regulator
MDRKGTILVVEDTVESRQLYQRTLEAEGYVVLTAINGDEGIKKIKELTTPSILDLIILDYAMPGSSGLDFLKGFENFGSVKVPILSVSEYTETELLKAYEGCKIKPSAYLRIPCEPEVLVSKINSLIK